MKKILKRIAAQCNNKLTFVGMVNPVGKTDISFALSSPKNVKTFFGFPLRIIVPSKVKFYRLVPVSDIPDAGEHALVYKVKGGSYIYV